ncbi:Ig-like domain-containing protein [Streptomyces sp. NPDC051976]|uniref:Ig-like domain-containing protein n=1 Tax=Streptomyces sp. NPDC051976 TaxID=3154947 RepID=UPI00344018DE
MMFTAARRSLAVAVAGLLAAGTVALATGAAQADVPGAMGVFPATGTDTSGMQLTTAGPCPADATNLIVSVTGSGFPAAGQNVVSNSPISTYSNTPDGGIVVPLTQTMRDYASTAGFSTLQGRYDFTLTCRAAFGSATYGGFGASVWFTSNTAYQTTAPAVATTTALTVAPAGSVVQGTSVTLTAAVAPAGAAGSVQFMDGTKAVGSPVAVAAGSAKLTTGTLAVGAHTLSARFTPADSAAFLPSTSAGTSLTVKIKPPSVVTAPKVTGTAKVGATVTCAVTFGGATSVTYAWLRDTTVISGYTAHTHVLQAADYRHKIACRATAANSTGKTTATSPGVSVALGAALHNTVRPTLAGTVRTGHRIAARNGTWSPVASSYTYVWLRDGHVIRGAVHSAYVLTSADHGHLISVRVTAKRSGYADGSAASVPVRVG